MRIGSLFSGELSDEGDSVNNIPTFLQGPFSTEWFMRIGAAAAPFVIEIDGSGPRWKLPSDAPGNAGLVVQLMRNDPMSCATKAINWARCGFPQIVIGHRLASSLMSTTLRGLASGEVHSPWHTWAIKIPKGTLVADSDTGDEIDVEFCIVTHTIKGNIHVAAFAGDMLGCIWNHPAQSLDQLIIDDVESIELDTDRVDGELPLTSRDNRMLAMLGRLVIGSILELDSQHSDRVSNAPRQHSIRRHGPPKAWTFVLGREVAIDTRASVRAFINGTRRAAPSVQSLVRGHWKRQAHGPNRSLRKWIHIEPFWRGPEDAPIVSRAHVTP